MKGDSKTFSLHDLLLSIRLKFIPFILKRLIVCQDDSRKRYLTKALQKNTPETQDAHRARSTTDIKRSRFIKALFRKSLTTHNCPLVCEIHCGPGSILVLFLRKLTHSNAVITVPPSLLMNAKILLSTITNASKPKSYDQKEIRKSLELFWPSFFFFFRNFNCN